ncbi:hypothetical protein CCR75_001468 [Bremia lactucae]|uniref:Uncharacterized protein n=1 Tax=Bremia lactucae TaxID=4779 RepID=A0A976P089_BRELC|nr:hypothetical protein CCR75_001468 [Bremia lactucae]
MFSTSIWKSSRYVETGELLEKLRTYGMTMQNVALIVCDQQVQVINICLAWHGRRNCAHLFYDQIVEMEIVAPAKGQTTLRAPQRLSSLKLVKCGLGTLNKVTMQCVPMHKTLGSVG